MNKWKKILILSTVAVLIALYYILSAFYGPQLIINAIYNDDIKMLNMLLFLNPFLLQSNTEAFGTPLHSAVFRNKKDIVSLLVFKGAHINAKDKQGDTPLHRAAETGNIEIIRFLLSHGANINEKNKTGSTPLYLACGQGNFEATYILITSGADVNIYNTSRITPLMVAVISNHVKISGFLIASGAMINTQNSTNGNTPLHFASEKGNINLVKLLIKHSADLNILNYENKKPIDLALKNNHKKAADILGSIPKKGYQEDSHKNIR